MNISSVSSTTNTSYSSASTTTDTSSLEKQKATLTKELQTEQASKDDEKTKSAKVAQIQAQIQIIDSEIQAIKSSKTSGASDKQGPPPQNADNKNNITANKSSEESNNIVDFYA